MDINLWQKITKLWVQMTGPKSFGMMKAAFV
jgi:hypothetical protein